MTDISDVWRSAWLLAKGAMPAVVVATLIPLALFWIAVAAGGVMWGIVVSVAYAYAVSAYQWARRHRMSGMLMVTVFMTTVRAGSAGLSGHPTVFFAIPVLETAGFGLMFVATMFSSEPLVLRLARDLVPHAAPGLAGERSLIRSLSLVWTFTYLASGTTTLVLLDTLPLPVFMGAHTLTGWFWTGSGAVASFLLCRRRQATIVQQALAW